jgi:hypothetical protein
MKLAILNDSTKGYDVLKGFSLVTCRNLEDVERAKPDAILFAGGVDINPAIYHSVASSYTERPDKKRDAFELEVIKRYPDLPKIGICRGMQLLWAANGEKLIQHVNGHLISHMIDTYDNGCIPSNSAHHQMVFVSEKDEEEGKCEILARSSLLSYKDEYDCDTSYLLEDDLIIENAIECESLYIPNLSAFCIQGHPEWLPFDHPLNLWANKQIKKYLF